MRTRTIMTVAILSAGCGTSGTTGQAPASKPVAATSAAPTPAKALSPTTPAVTTVMALPAPVTAAAAPMATNDPVPFEDLAAELRRSPPPSTAAALAHFRPLCDADGYPLVGNLATKSVNPAPVAAFCAGVRTRGAR